MIAVKLRVRHASLISAQFFLKLAEIDSFSGSLALFFIDSDLTVRILDDSKPEQAVIHAKIRCFLQLDQLVRRIIFAGQL